MNHKSIQDIVMALFGARGVEARFEMLTNLLVDLLVEVEALRGAVAQMSVGTGGTVHSGYDFPCDDTMLLAGKPAYPTAYVNAAYALHNSAGPTGGLEKLLARFYPAAGDGRREALMLRRLGFSDVEIARFVKAAEDAGTFT